jgi:hypothetical protein
MTVEASSKVDVLAVAEKVDVLNRHSQSPSVHNSSISSFRYCLALVRYTPEETVKGEEPVGRLDKAGVDTYEPLATTRAAFG